MDFICRHANTVFNPIRFWMFDGFGSHIVKIIEFFGADNT